MLALKFGLVGARRKARHYFVEFAFSTRRKQTGFMGFHVILAYLKKCRLNVVLSVHLSVRVFRLIMSAYRLNQQTFGRVITAFVLAKFCPH